MPQTRSKTEENTRKALDTYAIHEAVKIIREQDRAAAHTSAMSPDTGLATGFVRTGYFNFEMLPPELRNMIYSLALGSSCIRFGGPYFPVLDMCEFPRRNLAILRLNKATSEEASAMFHSSYTVSFANSSLTIVPGCSGFVGRCQGNGICARYLADPRSHIDEQHLSGFQVFEVLVLVGRAQVDDLLHPMATQADVLSRMPNIRQLTLALGIVPSATSGLKPDTLLVDMKAVLEGFRRVQVPECGFRHCEYRGKRLDEEMRLELNNYSIRLIKDMVRKKPRRCLPT